MRRQWNLFLLIMLIIISGTTRIFLRTFPILLFISVLLFVLIKIEIFLTVIFLYMIPIFYRPLPIYWWKVSWNEWAPHLPPPHPNQLWHRFGRIPPTIYYTSASIKEGGEGRKGGGEWEGGKGGEENGREGRRRRRRRRRG